MLRIVNRCFISGDPAPCPECHASTILKTGENRFVAAWFAGTKEANPDVMIYSSIFRGNTWSKPCCVTTEGGIQHWNPALFRIDDTRIRLYYKTGYPISSWKTSVLESTDEGETWSEKGELVPGDETGGRGPVKNKPVRLSNGRILAPASVETIPWRPFADISDDNGETWTKAFIPVKDNNVNSIQPTIWESTPGNVHALMRTNTGFIYRSDSSDYGSTWSDAYSTGMPNNNAGIDCVTVQGGKLFLICNPVGKDWGPRTPLSLLESADNGHTFAHALDLETEKDAGEFSYPAVVADGARLYITYTWKRKKICFTELEIV